MPCPPPLPAHIKPPHGQVLLRCYWNQQIEMKVDQVGQSEGSWLAVICLKLEIREEAPLVSEQSTSQHTDELFEEVDHPQQKNNP